MTDAVSQNQKLVRKMAHYMVWANDVVMGEIAKLPDAEIMKQRVALFGSIAHTMNHILVVEFIFQAHLEGRSHPYTKRNTESSPPFAEVRSELKRMDQYFLDLAYRWTDEELDEVVEFTYVGGGEGAMTRMEILLHLVNHATYHRGFVSDMLFEIPFQGASNDFSVFLRDAWPAIEAKA